MFLLTKAHALAVCGFGVHEGPKMSALPVDTHPEIERRGLLECTDSPREAVFIGMCTSLPCQKKKTKVKQAGLELANLALQVVRANEMRLRLGNESATQWSS